MVIFFITKISEIKILAVGMVGPALPNAKLKNILKTGDKIIFIISIPKKKLITGV